MSGLLRKAGDAIAGLDERYAARVRKDSPYLPATQLLGGQALGIPVASPGKEIAMDMAKEVKGPASPGAIKRHQAAELALGAGIVATNAAYRYGLPAAGITLAGKGLIDTASMLDQQTSGTLDPK